MIYQDGLSDEEFYRDNLGRWHYKTWFGDYVVDYDFLPDWVKKEEVKHGKRKRQIQND